MTIKSGTEYKTIRQVAIDIKKGYQGRVEFENEVMPRMTIENKEGLVVGRVIPKDPSYFFGNNEFIINPKGSVSNLIIQLMYVIVKENEHMDDMEYLRQDTKRFFEDIKKSNGREYRMKIGDKEIIFENDKSLIHPYLKNDDNRMKDIEKLVPFDSISGLEKIIKKAMIGAN